MTIDFSIIVPIYNVQKYLKRCIESILNQSYIHFELILVNDGSTDSCLQICESYMKKDGRIKLINQTNKGLLLARRVGLQVARGEYILHVDSDDMCEKDMLYNLKKSIEKTNADLIMFNYKTIDLNDKVIKEYTIFSENEKENLTKESLLKIMVDSTKINTLWIKCARRKIVDVNEDYSKYHRLMMGEDVLQSLPIIEQASRITYIDQSLYLYRVNPNGMSRKVRKEYLFDFLNVRLRFLLTLLKLNANNETIMLFYNKYYHSLVNYKLKITLVCSNSEEYAELLREGDVKEEEIKNIYNKNVNKRSVSITDQIINNICCHSFYLAKLIAKAYY